jgi:predicted ester cyclase
MAMPKEPKGRNTIAIRRRNKSAVRQIIEAFNSGNTDLIDKAIHPKLIDNTPAFHTSPNREGVKQQVKIFRELFPDARFTEELIIAEGNMVFLRWQMTGTFQGKLFGREGTGKEITHHGHEILLLDDAGRIVEHMDTFNVVTFMDKLGLMDAEMLQQIREAGLLGAPSDKSALTGQLVSQPG